MSDYELIWCRLSVLEKLREGSYPLVNDERYLLRPERITALATRQDMIAKKLRPPSTEKALRKEPIEKMLPKEPIEPIEKLDPMEPIENADL